MKRYAIRVECICDWSQQSARTLTFIQLSLMCGSELSYVLSCRYMYRGRSSRICIQGRGTASTFCNQHNASILCDFMLELHIFVCWNLDWFFWTYFDIHELLKSYLCTSSWMLGSTTCMDILMLPANQAQICLQCLGMWQSTTSIWWCLYTLKWCSG